MEVYGTLYIMYIIMVILHYSDIVYNIMIYNNDDDV